MSGDVGVNADTGIETEVPEAQKGGGFSDPFVYLSEGAPALKARQIGLVSGIEVPLMEVALPAALRGHAREQVAERQLCDALASGRESVEIHPFHSPGEERAWTRVLVADRTRLDAWRHMAGPACKAVLPDYLALPAGEGIWTLGQTGGGVVLARLGPADGFSALPGVAERLLKDALAGPGPRPRAVYSPGALRPELETLFAAHDVPVARNAEALRALDLELPKPLTHGELAFDLRRDPRAARARLRASVLPWRWPVLVGLIAAGLWAAAQMLAIRGIEEQTAHYRAVTLETVRAEFVPSGPVLDIRTQVSRALAEARVAAASTGNAVSPLDLLGLAADVTAARKAVPDYADYTVENGLSALIRVENFAASDDLTEALREAGLKITVVESRVSDGQEGVRTELRIAAPDRAGTEGSE